MLLKEYPDLRTDRLMMEAFMFIIDFLEAVAKETNSVIDINQKLLKKILEAAKISERKIDEVLINNIREVSLIYSKHI